MYPMKPHFSVSVLSAPITFLPVSEAENQRRMMKCISGNNVSLIVIVLFNIWISWSELTLHKFTVHDGVTVRFFGNNIPNVKKGGFSSSLNVVS